MSSAAQATHLYDGLDLSDPQPQAAQEPSYVAMEFQRIVNSKQWYHARQTFVSSLLLDGSIDAARLTVVSIYG